MEIIKEWPLCLQAQLAMEAGLSYGAMALVTDYDCWREDTEHVSMIFTLFLWTDS